RPIRHSLLPYPPLFRSAVCPAAPAAAARAASPAGTVIAHSESSQPARPTATAREPTTPVTPSPWWLANSATTGRVPPSRPRAPRSEEHTSELQSPDHLV